MAGDKLVPYGMEVDEISDDDNQTIVTYADKPLVPTPKPVHHTPTYDSTYHVTMPPSPTHEVCNYVQAFQPEPVGKKPPVKVREVPIVSVPAGTKIYPPVAGEVLTGVKTDGRGNIRCVTYSTDPDIVEEQVKRPRKTNPRELTERKYESYQLHCQNRQALEKQVADLAEQIRKLEYAIGFMKNISNCQVQRLEELADLRQKVYKEFKDLDKEFWDFMERYQ